MSHHHIKENKTRNHHFRPSTEPVAKDNPETTNNQRPATKITEENQHMNLMLVKLLVPSSPKDVMSTKETPQGELWQRKALI